MRAAAGLPRRLSQLLLLPRLRLPPPWLVFQVRFLVGLPLVVRPTVPLPPPRVLLPRLLRLGLVLRLLVLRSLALPALLL